MRPSLCAAAIFAAAVLVGCRSSERGASPANPLAPPDSVVLEIDGKAFQAGCANGSSGGGFESGATCGSAGAGAGPTFHSLQCHDTPTQDLPIYFLGTMFRNFDPAGVTDEKTFDLSDPAHEQFVTVMLDYMDLTGTEYDYCTAPPHDGGDATYPPASGLVTLHRLVPDPGAPPNVYVSEVEVTDAIIPSPNGGPTVKIVAAHLYFQ